MPLETVPVQDLRTEHGISVPVEVDFRQIIVTGPPDCGKSTLVRSLGGWPEEGYVDLTEPNWWLNRLLTLRPREVHLGLPFLGHERGQAVFDDEWLANPTDLDPERVVIPPAKHGFFSVDWRERFVFDVQLPPLEEAYVAATEAASAGKHRLNQPITRDVIARQLVVHEQLALLFHRAGIGVYVRLEFDGPPHWVVDG